MKSRKSRVNKMNKSQYRKQPTRRSARFESLENRHLLSAVGLSENGIVEVTGTEEADEIAAFVDDGQFVVEINGATVSYNNEDVEGLYVEALGGDDNVRVDDTVLQPTLIFGGTGNDTIQGGVGGDVILGGSDDDTIYGNTANDVLLGDGPNSLAEVPLPAPETGETASAIAPDTPIIVDLAPIDPAADPLGLHKYLSRVSGINAGSDTIVAGSGSDWVFAGQQDDNVEGDGANVIPVPEEVAPVEANETDTAPDLLPPDILPAGNDYIEAGAGNDEVDAGYGANVVFGGGGNDTLDSGAAADIVLGGDGDDTIRTHGGNDTVLGDGPNTINQVILTAENYYHANSALGSGNDYVEAGAGADHVFTGDTSESAINLIFGGSGDDRIYGGRGLDGIVGGGGNDTIRGGASADIVLGDGPNSLADLPVPVPGEPSLVDLAADLPAIADIAPIDLTDANPLPLLKYLSRVSGINAGRDTIVAGTGNDWVFAGARNDDVQGDGVNVYPVQTVAVAAVAVAPGVALVDEKAVDEQLVAPPGDDYIEAGRGNDTVHAGYGTNVVFGGNGIDTLTSGLGDDIVIGGSGGDVIRTNGGPDTVLGDGPATINQVILTAADIYLANSELGRGSDFIETGAGNDRVYAGRQRDVVFAGAGDDFAHGGRGSDLLVGGSGSDTLIGSQGSDVIITGGPNLGPNFGPSTDPIDDVVNSFAADGSQVNDQSNDYVEAGRGDDLVLAFGGNDLVFGGRGADNLFAGLGNDILVGGRGNDNIRAGGGNDVALGDGPNSLGDAILPLEPPASLINPNLLGVLLANSQLGRGSDVIDGGAGNDYMFGGANNDTIFGRTGNDLLHGGRGDDELFDDLNSGGDGTDVFVGAAGADKVFANDGPGGPVDVVFFDVDDELHVDGEDELILWP